MELVSFPDWGSHGPGLIPRPGLTWSWSHSQTRTHMKLVSFPDWGSHGAGLIPRLGLTWSWSHSQTRTHMKLVSFPDWGSHGAGLIPRLGLTWSWSHSQTGAWEKYILTKPPFLFPLQLVPVTCSTCRKNFCFKHRFETDHNCQGHPNRYQRSSGGLV